MSFRSMRCFEFALNYSKKIVSRNVFVRIDHIPSIISRSEFFHLTMPIVPPVSIYLLKVINLYVFHFQK